MSPIALLLPLLLAPALAVHQCTHDVNCTDLNPCTNDTCDKSGADWRCLYAFNALPCDDANECTVNDRCASGTCLGDHVVSNTCRLPGRTVVPTWLFVVQLGLFGVLLLVVVCYVCATAVAPSATRRSPSSYR
jgi:hypothetical protein